MHFCIHYNINLRCIIKNNKDEIISEYVSENKKQAEQSSAKLALKYYNILN